MTSKKILIAEDEDDTLMTLELIVERLGYVPLLACDGTRALDILVNSAAAGSPVDLLLCDIQMPGMTGEELVAEMQKRKLTTPVLIITGYGDKDLVVRLMRLGCRDFIDKPFPPDELETHIRQVLAENEANTIHGRRMEVLARIGESTRCTLHDINNAICGTAGYAEMMMEELPQNHPLWQRAEKITSSVRRATDICQQILSINLEESCTQRIRTDLNLCVERTVSLLEDVLPENINVTSGQHRYAVWYNADASRIQQALLNLGFNAAAAMPGGGELIYTITTLNCKNNSEGWQCPDSAKCCIAISVSNTGTGIPEDMIARIFDEGFMTNSDGTGIGLSSVKRIVEEHDGTIAVESIYGKRTVFRILFPGTLIH